MKPLILVLFLFVLPNLGYGESLILQQLRSEKRQLIDLNEQLLEQNKNLKKERHTLKKQKNRLALTTALTTATALTTSGLAIYAKKKTEKNTQSIKSLKIQPVSEKTYASQIMSSVAEENLNVSSETSIDSKCSLTTQTIFEAIDQNSLDQVSCWLITQPTSIEQTSGIESETVFYRNALAYAVGKEASEEIVLRLISEKPDLLYTKGHL